MSTSWREKVSDIEKLGLSGGRKVIAAVLFGKRLGVAVQEKVDDAFGKALWAWQRAKTQNRTQTAKQDE